MTKSLRLLHNLLFLLLGGSIMLTSCLDKDEVELTLSHDLIVSSVAYGTMTRTIHTTNAAGRDTIMRTSVSAAKSYPITIDHLNNKIYNLDSLPKGIDPAKIIFSTFSATGGTIGINSLITDRDTAYATTDTIDFSHPDADGKLTRIYTLYGNDGTSRRTYKVEVRLHQQSYDSLTWSKPTLEAWEHHNFGDRGTVTHYTTQGYTFSLQPGDILYATPGGQLQPDSIRPEEREWLPTANIAWASSTSRSDKSIIETLLYGTIERNGAIIPTLWRRNIDTKERIATGWEIIPTTSEIIYALPTLKDAGIYSYDDGYLLVGRTSDDKIQINFSIDRGRTWKTHDTLKLPAELKGKKISTLVSGLDAESNLWLLIDGHDIWCGRVHRLGWDTVQTAFK